MGTRGEHNYGTEENDKDLPNVQKRAIGIFCADLHLSDKPPVCRDDDWWAAMERVLEYLSYCQEIYKAPIFHAGDMFNDPYRNHLFPSHKLISFVNENLPMYFYTVYGNHDLPQHNPDRLQETAIWNMFCNDRIKLLCYGQFYKDLNVIVKGYNIYEPLEPIDSKDTLNIALVHHLCYPPKEPPYPGAPESGNVNQIIKKLKGYDFIVCGDNHNRFVYEKDGVTVINPGSAMRRTADQIDHVPGAYVIYDNKEWEFEPFPIDKDIISREHIDVKEEIDNKINTFVESLECSDIGLSFENNIEKMIDKNKVDNDIKQIIYKAMQEVL